MRTPVTGNFPRLHFFVTSIILALLIATICGRANSDHNWHHPGHRHRREWGSGPWRQR